MRSLTSVILKNSKRRELTNTSKFLSIISKLIVAGSLILLMVGFSVVETKRLMEINQSYTFVNILLFMNFIILFSETIFYSLNSLYFSKDLNIFLRLPIKPKDLIDAKLKEMVLSQYEMEILMLAIPIFIYGIIAQVSALFYLYAMLILLILPIIPISITTLIVSFIMRFTNLIKNKSRVMYITVILTIIILAFVLGGMDQTTEEISVSSVEKLILQVDGLANEISNKFILIKPIMNILVNYNNILGIKNLLIYIVETFLIYKIVVLVTSKIYLKGAIGTVINGQKYKKKLEKLTNKDLKQSNKLKTYFKKELKETFRSPIFFIQCILMPLIYPILTVVTVIAMLTFAQKIKPDTISVFVNTLTNGIGYAIFLAIGQGFFMINFSSIIAVSKEGRSSVLLKTFPIALEKQFKLKTKIGTLVNTLPIIIICIAHYYIINNFILTITIFFNLELLNIIGEKWKLLVDLNNPQIKWNTEYTMMKQNTNVMYGLFYTIIVIVTIIALGLICQTEKYASIVMFCILVLINLYINNYVHTKEQKIFEKLY